jgi:hypothetical protein
MEKHFLADFVADESRETPRPWYNGPGDCVMYQCQQDVAVVADRVDELLTLYRAADTRKVIGFKIKGVHALARKHGWDGIAIQAEESRGEIMRISMAALVLAAFGSGPRTVSRLRGYAEAVSACAAAENEVPIAATDAAELCYA